MTNMNCLLFVVLFVAVQIICTSSWTTTYLKLDPENVIQVGDGYTVPVRNICLDYNVFSIVTSTVPYEGVKWIKRSQDVDCPSCTENSTQSKWREYKNRPTYLEDEEVLDCGKPVNFTYFDNLVGVANRLSHPHAPEPQVALIFKKKATDIDIAAMEKKLKKAKREKPKSVQLYSQIGNFWRLKGDAYKSIECFRRALAVSPHDAEVLLNLARVLFALQYLDDAIYLTRRSLEVQPPDKSAWQQYFTLGEIFKAYGHYQEASLHMRHCLHLRPGFEPAEVVLKELEATPENNIHVYTLLIIVCLALGVLLVIISSMDPNRESGYSEQKGQRHFNKALAMRSLKMSLAPRGLRNQRNNVKTG